jgi:hypothetical protein
MLENISQVRAQVQGLVVVDNGLYLLDGIHDGTVTNNSIAFVSSSGAYNAGNAVWHLDSRNSTSECYRQFLGRRFWTGQYWLIDWYCLQSRCAYAVLR